MENNSQGRSHWDSSRVREGFRSAAKEAERYWDEIYPKVRSQPGYEPLVDEMIAKFYALDALGARAWNSPSQLAGAARELLGVDIREPQSFDPSRVKRLRELFLNNVIREYEHFEPNSEGNS